MKKSSLRNSQETSGLPDRVPGEGLWIRISTDDVLEAHAMKDVGKEKDNHVGMFHREGGEIGRGGSSWGERRDMFGRVFGRSRRDLGGKASQTSSCLLDPM